LLRKDSLQNSPSSCEEVAAREENPFLAVTLFGDDDAELDLRSVIDFTILE
jgi:hypothetical protein